MLAHLLATIMHHRERPVEHRKTGLDHAAFNHAYAAHAGDLHQEEAAHRIAWAAVKRSYIKTGNTWQLRAPD